MPSSPPGRLHGLLPFLVLLIITHTSSSPNLVSAELSSYDSRFHTSLDSYEDFTRERDDRVGADEAMGNNDDGLGK